MHLTQLNVYPVKSCHGIALTTAQLDARGIRFDRRWMVVGENYRLLTQREFPRLALVAVGMGEDHLRLSAFGMSDFHVPFSLAGGLHVRAVVWDDTVSAVDVGKPAAQWFSEFLNSSCRLVYMPDDADRIASRKGYSSQVSFADAYPFLLISESSLQDLNERLDETIPMNRFRPNLVVSGCEPYAEDTWTEIMVGGQKFHVAKSCARCMTTTVDQSTGEQGKEPLKTLATYRERDRKVFFGQNLIHEGRGVLSLGDEVKILAVINK